MSVWTIKEIRHFVERLLRSELEAEFIDEGDGKPYVRIKGYPDRFYQVVPGWAVPEKSFSNAKAKLIAYVGCLKILQAQDKLFAELVDFTFRRLILQNINAAPVTNIEVINYLRTLNIVDKEGLPVDYWDLLTISLLSVNDLLDKSISFFSTV